MCSTGLLAFTLEVAFGFSGGVGDGDGDSTFPVALLATPGLGGTDAARTGFSWTLGLLSPIRVSAVTARLFNTERWLSFFNPSNMTLCVALPGSRMRVTGSDTLAGRHTRSTHTELSSSFARPGLKTYISSVPCPTLWYKVSGCWS
uniref:Putative secreted protein n=1 Tax=Ixodes ricinus TaxID=34613 RepID=A0A6B0UUL6_IXORI